VRSEDFPEFQSLIEGLCAAFDRQCTDAKVKTFHEVLKPFHIADLKRSAASWKANFAKMPSPKELIPKRAEAPPPPKPDDGGPMSPWAVAANKLLFHLAYRDPRRGFKPMGDILPRLLEIKRDYVQMAENAELSGEPMDGQEFQGMCKEGFEKALGIRA
jgi:hypothetical protein